MLQGHATCSAAIYSALVRRAFGFSFALMVVFLFLASLSQPAESQTYKVIYNFTGIGTDGATPYGGPILDQAGNLYGTTNLGGRFGSGSVYELSPSGASWTYRSLHSFFGGADGAGPAFGTLAMYNGGLFGTTEGGGYFGTAFRVGLPCKNVCAEMIMHRFGRGTDGQEPIGGVFFDKAGNFYGTTLLGGVSGNGTVYQVKPSGIEHVLYSFAGGIDAVNPAAAVTVDGHGNLYGTTSFGGAYGNGAVYKLTHSSSGWTETVLYSFQGLNDGANPVGGVILDKAGNVYGGTFDGGANGGGIVYELSPSSGVWTMTILYSFTGGYGGLYNKLTFDTKGNLYGILNGESANGLGSVFKLTRSNGGWTYTDLYDFTGGSDGGLPYCQLAVDAKGNIFGTNVIGGSNNQGVVFEITP
jgi:uncharacterized repeat protein (TIGR03803 family)